MDLQTPGRARVSGVPTQLVGKKPNGKFRRVPVK